MKREEVKRDCLKCTTQKIRFDLVENNAELLNEFEVVASDRKPILGKEYIKHYYLFP